MNSIMHFIRTGWKGSNNPSPFFDTSFYIKNNSDVRQSNINPFIHYILHGRKEGRAPTPPKRSDSEILSLEVSTENHEASKPVFMNGHQLFVKYNQDDNQILDTIPQYDKKVSVIIPTKNAGKDFDFILKMLRNQEGFREIEIVIVDSGSSDNTINIAKSHNAKLIEILPEEFSHSYARNLGAELASGDYFLFTVQDALPPSKTWLNQLMTTLNNEDVCAVSCAESAREDVDLFYRVINWHFYNFLEVDNVDRIFSMPEEPNYINLRKNGQISNLACLIPAKIFLQYKFRFDYAEDLDLGVRIIKDGKRIAFLGTTRIIHSHNRPDFFFMKRGYADMLFLSKIFSDYPIPGLNYHDLAQDIVFTYNFLNTKIIDKIKKINFPVNVLTLEGTIKQQLLLASNFNYPQNKDISPNPYMSSELFLFAKSFLQNQNYVNVGKKYDGSMIKDLLGFVNMTFAYVKTYQDSVNEDLKEEIINCLYKGIALLFGEHLAYCYLTGSDEERKLMRPIHSTLRENV